MWIYTSNKSTTFHGNILSLNENIAKSFRVATFLLTVYHMRPHDHVSDALATLHWLHVPERVQYKIAVLTFKVLHDSASRYLGPLVALADLPGRRALRSASTSRLVVPPIKLLAAVPFRLLQLKSGTVCQRPSSHRHHRRLSAVN